MTRVLAEAYLKEDRDDEARRLLEEILTMALDEGYEFEFRENQEEARRQLEKGLVPPGRTTPWMWIVALPGFASRREASWSARSCLAQRPFGAPAAR